MENLNDKLMSNDELDMVVGAYEYEMVNRYEKNGRVVYHMRNLKTGGMETYSGRDDRSARFNLFLHNLRNREKRLVIRDKRGGILEDVDVYETARQLKLIS